MSDERSSAQAAQPPRDASDEPDILEEIQAEVAAELDEERPPAGGPAYQLVGTLVALAIGVGGAVLAYGYGLGSLRRPGPGLWPFIVCLVIIVLSLSLLVVGRRLADSEAFTRASVLPVVGVLTFIAMGALIPVIGFEIPALLLCVVWLRFLGNETWRSTVVISVCTVAAFYLLFLYGLRIPLPHLI